MHFRNFVGFDAVSALLAQFFLVALTYAADSLDMSGDVEALPAGMSLLSVPALEDFGTITQSPIDQTTDAQTFSGFVEYVDMRGTQAAYDINVTATNLEDTTDSDSISFSQLRIRANGTSPALVTVGGSGCTDGTSPRTTFAAFTGTGSVSQPVNLVHGTDGSVSLATQCRFKPVVQIVVPGLQPSGVYRTTLTFSLI